MLNTFLLRARPNGQMLVVRFDDRRRRRILVRLLEHLSSSQCKYNIKRK